MICPSKLCKAEILDDSLYCDQCGIKILKCSKCGATGISKFCGKCGGMMTFTGDSSIVSNKTVAESSKPMQNIQPTQSQSMQVDSNSQIATTSAQSQISRPAAAGTQFLQLEPQEKSLQLCNSNGILLNVKDGSILGRTTGDFVQQLGTIPVISSRHAQITKQEGKWFVTDLHSTNKTYVNNMQLTPDVPIEIKENDVIILANITFVARFK